MTNKYSANIVNKLNNFRRCHEKNTPRKKNKTHKIVQVLAIAVSNTIKFDYLTFIEFVKILPFLFYLSIVLSRLLDPSTDGNIY